MKKQPNIIFIMTDQQRFDTFSFNNPEVKTPNLDALIGDSVFFENAYCSNPSCVPSRAAIMTGKYPSECQCPDFITYLPTQETTFMTRLQQAGYETSVIGKQHFGKTDIAKGYDEEYIIDGHFPTSPNKGGLSHYLDFLKENGIDPKTLWEPAFISGGFWQGEMKYHLDEYIGELGKQWIEKRAEKTKAGDEKPWFFTLSFPGPHHPYDLEGTKYADMYDLDALSLPTSDDAALRSKPLHYKEMNQYARIYLKDFSNEDYLRSKRSYYANMTLIDEKVGEFIALLKENNLYDDTLIIFSSDHGDFMGDYGLMEKLQCLQNSLMHVPLFVKPPIANFKGKIITDPVTNLDIASTCLTAAQASVPSELCNVPYNQYWDETKEVTVRDYIYMEAARIKGCIHHNIKTICYIGRPYGELYDLSHDPQEVNNLWDDPAYQAAKLKGCQIIMQEMYHAIPLWSMPWNYGTPEV